jgi:hypothetical protein
VSVHCAPPRDHAVPENPFLGLSLAPVRVLDGFIVADDECVAGSHSHSRPHKISNHSLVKKICNKHIVKLCIALELVCEWGLRNFANNFNTIKDGTKFKVYKY